MATPSSGLPATMKAWTFDRYGSPDVLAWTDVPLPTFRDEDELLVRVRAASVNPADRHSLKPPFLFRRRQGFLRPRLGRLGSDFAGRIEEVGKNVRDLHVGDEVFGVGRGTFAEYAVADQSQVMLRPAGLSPEQAAAAPIAGVTALQGLRDRGHLGPGQRVLINGASGGVGTYAVQIAAALGAEVSAVSGPQNVEQTRSLGASRVIDYSTEDFTRSGLRWDLIVDTQLNHSLAQYRAALNRRGTLVAIGAGPGPVGPVLRRLLGTWAASQIVGPRLRFFIASIQRKSLEEIAALLVSGKVASVIDRRYPLSEVPAAIRYLAEGHARGKILVTYGT